MRSSAANKQQGTDLIGRSAGDNARLQACLGSRDAEWIDAVTYWCDYLTIIDLGEPAGQACAQPVSKRARGAGRTGVHGPGRRPRTR